MRLEHRKPAHRAREANEYETPGGQTFINISETSSRILMKFWNLMKPQNFCRLKFSKNLKAYHFIVPFRVLIFMSDFKYKNRIFISHWKISYYKNNNGYYFEICCGISRCKNVFKI